MSLDSYNLPPQEPTVFEHGNEIHLNHNISGLSDPAEFYKKNLVIQAQLAAKAANGSTDLVHSIAGQQSRPTAKELLYQKNAEVLFKGQTIKLWRSEKLGISITYTNRNDDFALAA